MLRIGPVREIASDMLGERLGGPFVAQFLDGLLLLHHHLLIDLRQHGLRNFLRRRGRFRRRGLFGWRRFGRDLGRRRQGRRGEPQRVVPVRAGAEADNRRRRRGRYGVGRARRRAARTIGRTCAARGRALTCGRAVRHGRHRRRQRRQVRRRQDVGADQRGRRFRDRLRTNRLVIAGHGMVQHIQLLMRRPDGSLRLWRGRRIDLVGDGVRIGRRLFGRRFGEARHTLLNRLHDRRGGRTPPHVLRRQRIARMAHHMHRRQVARPFAGTAGGIRERVERTLAQRHHQRRMRDERQQQRCNQNRRGTLAVFGDGIRGHSVS